MLKDTVPGFVARMLEMAELFEAEQPELDHMRAVLLDIVNQFYIKTATYSLSKWEKELGVTCTPTMTIAQRRGQLLAKLNTRSPASVEMLENLVQQVLGAEKVTIVEHYSDYSFSIYVNTQYIAQNLGIADKAVYEARPAHLSYRFINELIRESLENIYIGTTGMLIKVFDGELEKYKINRNADEIVYAGAYMGYIKIFSGEVST